MRVRLSSSRGVLAISSVGFMGLCAMLLAITVHAQMAYEPSTTPTLTLPPPPSMEMDTPIPFPIHPSRCRWQVRDADGPCAGDTSTCQAGICASGLSGAPDTSREYFNTVYLVEELPGSIGMAVDGNLESRACWEERQCGFAAHYKYECLYAGLWYCAPDETGTNNCYVFKDGDVIHTEKYEATTLIECPDSFEILAMRFFPI